MDGNYRLDHMVAAAKKEILKATDVTERNIREEAITINQKLQVIGQTSRENASKMNDRKQGQIKGSCRIRIWKIL